MKDYTSINNILFFKGDKLLRYNSIHTIIKDSNTYISALVWDYFWRVEIFDKEGNVVFDTDKTILEYIDSAKIIGGNIHMILRGNNNIGRSRCKKTYVVYDIYGNCVFEKIIADDYKSYRLFGEQGFFDCPGFEPTSEKNKFIVLLDNNGNIIYNTNEDLSTIGYLLMVKKNDKCSFYNSQLELMPIDNASEDSFFYHLNLQIVSSKNKQGAINKDCDMIIPCLFDEIIIEESTNHFNYLRVKKNGRWGLMTMSGDVLIDCKYEDIKYIGEDLFCFSENRKWGFRSLKDESIVIPCVYDDAKAFFDGLAPVLLKSKWGYINNKNEIVIPFQYITAESFNGGLAVVSDDINDSQYVPSSIEDIAHEENNKEISTINDVIQKVGFATCSIGGKNYIHSTLPIVSNSGLDLHISGIIEGNNTQVQLITLFEYDNDINRKVISIVLHFDNKQDVEVLTTCSIFDKSSQPNVIFRAEIDISKDVETILQSCVSIELRGEFNKSINFDISREKQLVLRHLCFNEEISSNDITEILLRKPIPNKSASGTTGESKHTQIKRCIDELRAIDFSDLDNVYNLIYNPKTNKAFEKLVMLTKEVLNPHPIIELLSKVPRKEEILEDIKTVRDNREFKNKHKLISYVLNKNDELSEGTIKFINLIKSNLE